MNRKEIAILALILFLTVIAWSLFSFYHAKNSNTDNSIKALEIKPLNPKFDEETVKNLLERQK